MLSTLDLIIIGAYFLLLIVVGWLSGRNESQEDFLIGGRAIKTFQSAATIGSSLVGAGMLLTYIALVYTIGAGALWLFIGYIFGFVIFYHFAKYLRPMADQHKFYTLPDFFYHKYGQLAGRLTAVIVVLVSLGWIVVNFIGGGKTITTFTGIDFQTSTIVVGIVIALYLAAGGFKAVVKTDSIQFIGLLFLLVLMGYLLAKYSLTLSLQDLNIFSLPTMQLISFFLVGIILPLASGEFWQRVYAVKDMPTLRKSFIGLSIFLLVIGVVLLLIGLIIRKHLPEIDPDTALVNGFATMLPEGWAGLAVVVFYSAIMSSSDTYLFTASASLTQDLVYRGKDVQNSTKRSRVSIFVLALIAIGLAIGIKDVVDATYFLVALMFALGIVVLLIWQFKTIKRSSVLIGLILGLLAVVIGLLALGISEDLVIYAMAGVLAGTIIGLFFKKKI